MSISIAEQLEENEQYDKAYEEYKKVYAKTPKSIDLLERLGHLAVMLQKQDEATEYYTKILELDRTSVLAYEQLMDIYVHTDRYKYYVNRGNLHLVQQELSHAANDFKKALDKAATVEETNTTRFILAGLYAQLGKNNRAIDEYLRILDTGAVNEVVFLQLAQIYVNEDSLSSAVEILERARNNGFDTANVKENLAQLYLRTGMPDKARSLTQDELVMIKSLLEEEKNQAAFELLESLKGKFARNAQYKLLLAQYYFNVKSWDKSLAEVEEFDKIEQNSPLAYQMRAMIYEEKGSDFEAHINWAKYSLARKDKDVALNEYLAAYQLNDSDTVLLRNIAELNEDIGDKAHAVEFWERLAKIDPSSRKALEKSAEFKESIGDYRGEAELLEKLYELDKRNTIVVKNLAKCYEKLRNKEKALEFYNKLIAISPVNEDYEMAQVKVKKLESTEMEEDEGLLGKLIGLFAKK